MAFNSRWHCLRRS